MTKTIKTSGNYTQSPERGRLAGTPIPSCKLQASVPVLLRPGAHIQFGVDPFSSLVLPIPDGIEPGAVFSGLLAHRKEDSLGKSLLQRGVPESFVCAMVSDLISAGLTVQQLGCPPLTIIGKDVVRARLNEVLRGSQPGQLIQSRGITPQTASWLRTAPLASIGTVAITGMEVPTLPLIETLWNRRIAHVHVNFRDNALVIGPYCNPPVGPCVMCVELHRRDADPARELLALQLKSQSFGPPEQWLNPAVSVVAGLLRRDEVEQFQGVEMRLDFAAPSAARHKVAQHPRCPICSHTLGRSE